MPESFEEQVAAALGKLYDWQLAGRVAAAIEAAWESGLKGEQEYGEPALRALRGET